MKIKRYNIDINNLKEMVDLYFTIQEIADCYECSYALIAKLLSDNKLYIKHKSIRCDSKVTDEQMIKVLNQTYFNFSKSAKILSISASALITKYNKYLLNKKYIEDKKSYIKRVFKKDENILNKDF